MIYEGRNFNTFFVAAVLDVRIVHNISECFNTHLPERKLPTKACRTHRFIFLIQNIVIGHPIRIAHLVHNQPQFLCRYLLGWLFHPIYGTQPILQALLQVFDYIVNLKYRVCLNSSVLIKLMHNKIITKQVYWYNLTNFSFD